MEELDKASRRLIASIAFLVQGKHRHLRTGAGNSLPPVTTYIPEYHAQIFTKQPEVM